MCKCPRGRVRCTTNKSHCILKHKKEQKYEARRTLQTVAVLRDEAGALYLYAIWNLHSATTERS